MKKLGRNSHILITQLRLHDYAGSEVVTLELSEEFSRRGMKVTVVSPSLGGDIVDELLSIRGVKVFQLDSDDFNNYIDQNPVDLAWIHHQIIPESLLDSHSGVKFIFHHMSPFEGPEVPLFSRLESSLASKVLIHSDKTRDKFLSKGLILDDERIEVFNNPAPDYFLNEKESLNTEVKNILIVSNHPPNEIRAAMAELNEDHGVKVTWRGSLDEDKTTRVTPLDIQSADVVVTIGKTTQYAILSSRPVYNYDHFGGPGYITREYMANHSDSNFSGRYFGSKTPDDIATEILNGYSRAKRDAKYIYDSYRDKYTLSKRIDNVLSHVQLNGGGARGLLGKIDIESYKLLRGYVFSRYKGSAHTLSKLNAENQKISQEVNSLKYENERIRVELDKVTGSKGYILGNILATPYRRVKVIFKRALDKNDKI